MIGQRRREYLAQDGRKEGFPRISSPAQWDTLFHLGQWSQGAAPAACRLPQPQLQRHRCIIHFGHHLHNHY